MNIVVRGDSTDTSRQSYRTEDFIRAAELYASLLRQEEAGDLVKNKKPGRQDLDAFETAYNAACGSIARGELGQAEVLLRRSKGKREVHLHDAHAHQSRSLQRL